MQLITVSKGDTHLSTPDAALALQVLTGLSAQPGSVGLSSAPPLGEPWPGEGGVNGGLFQGGDRPYYLIIPIGADAEAKMEFGSGGTDQPGAMSSHDGTTNTADLVETDNTYPAAQFCAKFERDGHKDFYLMARREASFLEGTVPQTFSKGSHWTSTQYSACHAYYMVFENGWLGSGGKSYERLVRPVRRKYF